jgi:hypothetical protein
VSQPQPQPAQPLEPMRLLHGLRRELGDIARGRGIVHADLRARLVGVGIVSVVVDLVAAGAALAFEDGDGRIDGYGNALFWTTTQLLTVSSQFPNPLTTGGKILDVFLEFYAITVVTSVAGAFGAFFHHRTQHRINEKRRIAESH